MKNKTATIAVISDNKVLILRRGSTAPWMPGRYCLPGGHVEHNEDSQYAATRELSEEVGISFPVDDLIPITISYSSGYSKIVYIAKINNPKIVLNFEHDHYTWVGYNDSFFYPLVPGLRTTLKTLLLKNYII